MIDETILYLPHTGCGNSPLKKHEKELSATAGWDPDMRVGEPLRKVFTRVLHYDFGKRHAQVGVTKTNDEIIDLVLGERPKYVLWPTMSYEILESTFQKIRSVGTLVIGWFFDDICRFDDYSRWWIPYLDYVFTVDKEAVNRYRELGGVAMHLLVTSNPSVFRRLEAHEKTFDASFVGIDYSDRRNLIEELRSNGIEVRTFGKGWSRGHIPLDEMIRVYNSSKINISLMRSYAVETGVQMKCKIFDICMCGGFMLSEYVPGIEEHFEIDKEIVCFKDMEDAVEKIRYYLSHETERQEIAQAGWERAQRDHHQSIWMLRVFEEIEKDTRAGKQGANDHEVHLEMPPDIRCHPSSFHLKWAMALMEEGFDRHRWQEELDLALFYNPENAKALQLSRISCFPAPVPVALIRLWKLKIKLVKLKRAFRSYLSSKPLLRKIKQTLVTKNL